MRLGIVFSGGGGKGAYQIGVWKALIELDLIKYVKGIAGTSIGSLNLMFFLNGDIEVATRFWIDLKRNDFVNLNKSILEILKLGYISEKDNLNNKLKNNMKFNILKTTDISAKVVCTEIKKIGIKKRIFSLNNKDKDEVIEILLASCSIPFLYNYQYIKSSATRCYDGGIVSRTPVEALEYEKYDKIIIIHSDNLNRVNLVKYNKEKYINIYPTKYQGGIFMGTYGFTENLVMKRLERGYIDAIKKLNEFREG